MMDSSPPGYEWMCTTTATQPVPVTNDSYYYQMSSYPPSYPMVDQLGNPIMYNYPFMPCPEGQPPNHINQPLPPLITDNWQLLPPEGVLVTNQPPLTKTLKPQGCKTLFIGSLPKQIFEDIDAAKNLIREIFGRIDVITEVRVNTRGFAHVRFSNEGAVDRAIWFNGSKLIIGKNGTKDSMSFIHLDYSENSKDLDEVIRHRVEEMHRSQSPSRIIQFSTFEANLLLEKMKNNNDIDSSIETLYVWLERGEANRRSVTLLYTMIQSAFSHIKRLQNEQKEHYQSFISAKNQYLCRIQEILKLMDQIKRIFEAASKQKCWDHFTKAQRKNLASWKSSVQDTIKQEKNNCMNWRTEDEMEMSDSDEADENENEHENREKETSTVPSNPKILKTDLHQELNILQQKNDQLEMEKIQQLESIGHLTQENESLKSTITTLTSSSSSSSHPPPSSEEMNSCDLDSEFEEMQLLKQRIQILEASLKSEQSLRAIKENELKSHQVETAQTTSSQPFFQFGKRQFESEMIVKCIGVIISFLLVHPLGASTDYIWSYLSQLGYKIKAREIEELLETLPSCFKLVVNGVGAKIEKRWQFVGLQATEVVEPCES